MGKKFKREAKDAPRRGNAAGAAFFQQSAELDRLDRMLKRRGRVAKRRALNEYRTTDIPSGGK